MKTRQLIKTKALELFNQFGLRNTTLRQVATELQKSYGNITYHFKTKEFLIVELYNDLAIELQGLAKDMGEEHYHVFFNLSKRSFDIITKYMFFSIDYIELKRSYPILMKKVDEDNQVRVNQYKIFLKVLQKHGIIKNELTDPDLDYLMELSAALRIYFFQKNYGKEQISSMYSPYVYSLTYPYLSDKGLVLLKKWQLENR